VPGINGAHLPAIRRKCALIGKVRRLDDRSLWRPFVRQLSQVLGSRQVVGPAAVVYWGRPVGR
jgi:hypothetical protein